MEAYVLVSRNGTALGKTDCSRKHSKVHGRMKTEYKTNLKDLKQDGRTVEYSACSKFEATIEAGGEIWEWFIFKHEI